jgi:ABC-type branched-subunit amino acid transport system substrate-binding protein
MSAALADDAPRHEYVERMFPAPVDHGIAQPDRAVCSVRFGTSSHLEGTGGEGSEWYEGGGALGERAAKDIVIYPPTGGVQTQGDPFEPVKIGVLVDMDLGQLLADWLDPTILAIEDALNEGVWGRSPVQLVVCDARGLPRENYRKVIEGYHWLVEQGCVVILGPLISDNCLTVQPVADEVGVPLIGWTGAWRFASDFCFTVANGDIPTEGVMCANWLSQRGLKKVGLFWEAGSSGRDYADYFRDTALRLGLTVTREVMLEPNPRGLKEHLAEMRDMGTEGIYYGGYGYSTFHFAEAFRTLEWDPPRVMGTAFMFYSNSNAWAQGLEGWHGIDQLGEDGANPNYEALITRMQARFGRGTRNVVVALAYDTARAAIHGIANAAIPTPRHVRDGLERIRWMPATNGGPSCYIQFGPGDHKGYKGDFLTFRELRGGELRFDGYYRPTWPSNAAPT